MIARHPDLSLPRMLLAEVYLKLERYDASREQVGAAGPTWWDAVGLVDLGLKTIGTDYLYRLLTRRDPDREQTFLRGFAARRLFELGLEAFHHGKPDSARARYERAIQLDGQLRLQRHIAAVLDERGQAARAHTVRAYRSR